MPPRATDKAVRLEQPRLAGVNVEKLLAAAAGVESKARDDAGPRPGARGAALEPQRGVANTARIRRVEADARHRLGGAHVPHGKAWAGPQEEATVVAGVRLLCRSAVGPAGEARGASNEALARHVEHQT